jgi:hypothetical protein
MVKRWITRLVRRQRIAEYWRREFEGVLRDQRRADHLEHLRQGIKEPFRG